MRVEVETETPQKCLASAFENGDFFCYTVDLCEALNALHTEYSSIAQSVERRTVNP